MDMICSALSAQVQQKVQSGRADAETSNSKWRQQAAALRAQLDLPDTGRNKAPWSSCHRLQGLPDRPRVKEIVDLAYLATQQGQDRSDDNVKELVVDCSQNITRRPWCPKPPYRTFCTGSMIYIFAADRILLAEEEMRMHGIGAVGKLLHGIPFAEQYDIAGLGMALPAVGLAQMAMLQACYEAESLQDLFDYDSDGFSHGPHAPGDLPDLPGLRPGVSSDPSLTGSEVSGSVPLSS